MRRAKAVAGQVHEHMMLAVIIHPIGRDKERFEKIDACCSRMAHGVFMIWHDGVFSYISDTRHHHIPGRKRQ